MKEVLSWLVRWACRAGTYKVFLFCVGGSSSRPSTKYYINSFVPFPQQAGQAAVLGRLSLSVCLWIRTRNKICEPTLDVRRATHFLCIFFYCVCYVFLNVNSSFSTKCILGNMKRRKTIRK
jgi:hypothetical protein